MHTAIVTRIPMPAEAERADGGTNSQGVAVVASATAGDGRRDHGADDNSLVALLRHCGLAQMFPEKGDRLGMKLLMEACAIEARRILGPS
jgi:hypothetical protein